MTHRQNHWKATVLAGVAALVLFAGALSAQPFTPGVSYFGRSNYIEYIAGELPVIFSAPHGGTLAPAEIPDRTYGTFTTDSNTDDLARKLRTEFGNRFGLLPHVVICRLDRDKIDCNRDIVEGAQGDPKTEIAWNEFHGFIVASRTNLIAQHGRGFYVDVHGHGHAIQRLELGYLLSSGQLGLADATLNGSTTYRNQSSIRRLATESPLNFAAVLRGSNSFGALIANEGYPAVPSPDMPNPAGDPYFDGGYNTQIYGSIGGGPIDGLQIESNFTDVRDFGTNRTAYAQALARVLERYFAQHYGVNLREATPKLWIIGGGSWATAANWYNGALPVSTNHLLFAGAGGSLTHNLAALATGSGVIGSLSFSNSVAGSYTISGNAVSLVRGLTNNSTPTHTINNPITLVSTQTFAANSGALVIGGNLTNAGNQLRCLGNITLNGFVTGPGGLTKSGPGTLALTAINTYSGPTTNQAGVISLNATSTFGAGNGLLVLAGGEILSLNTRSVAPIPNPILMTGDTTVSGNSTQTNSTRILPFSANSVTTAGGTLTIRNAGANGFASNNVFRVRFTGGGFDFTRPITVGFVDDLPATLAQLESYNDNLVGDQTFSGAISGTGQFRRDAMGRTVLTGANSYSGGSIVSAGTLLVNNPAGSGTGFGFVAVSNTGTLGGTGTIFGPVLCVGTISPGQGLGTLTLGGGLDLSNGGTNAWELAALSETSEGVNSDQLVLTAGNLALGGTAKLELNFTGSASAPNAGEPFWLTSHSWKIISLTGTAVNTSSTRFPTIINGDYATGSFTNYADGSGNVWLAYLAVPAPAPVIQSVHVNRANEFVLSLTTESNRTYVLQSNTNLLSPAWVNVSTNIAPGNGLTLTNVNGGEPMQFYRVRVVP